MKSRQLGHRRSKAADPPRVGRAEIALRVVDLCVRAIPALVALLRVLLDVL